MDELDDGCISEMSSTFKSLASAKEREGLLSTGCSLAPSFSLLMLDVNSSKTFESTEIAETSFAGTLDTQSKLIGRISVLITGGRYCGSSLGDLR